MKEEMNVQLSVAIGLVLFFVLFSFASANNNDILATLQVATASKIDCKPDSLTIGSNLEWINCFIELENADVSDIDLSTVKLEVVGKVGEVFADPSFSNFDDFDFDGEPDLQVRFDREMVVDTFFFDVFATTPFTLEVSGMIGAFDFSGTDPLLLVKPPQKLFTRFIVNSTISKQSKVNNLPVVNLSKFQLSSVSFDGYFLSEGDPVLRGMSRVYVRGNLFVEKTIRLILFNFTFTERQPILATAFITTYEDCSVTDSENVYCEGTGFVLGENKKTGERFREELNKMIVEIKNRRGKLEGGEFWNDIFSATNIPIETIRVV